MDFSTKDYYKINVDAAYCTFSRITSLGAVARDEEALIGFSAVTKVEGIESSLQAETLAVFFFGLQMATEMNYEEVKIESDC